MTHRIITTSLPSGANFTRTESYVDTGNIAENSQHILVTGGTGFIGRSLVLALLQAGHQVSVWTRFASKAVNYFPNTVNIVENLHQIDEQQPVDTIINLAGCSFFEQRWSAKYKQELLRSRIALTQSLANWVENCSIPPRMLISGSSVYYYTNPLIPSMLCIDESTPKQNGFIADLCEQWENAAQSFERLHTKVIRLRLGFVLGNGGLLTKQVKKLKWQLGAVYHTGQQTFCWVHLQDVIRSILWILQKKPSAIQQNIYNVVSPFPVQQSTFIRTIAQIYGYKVRWNISARLLTLLLGQRAELYLSGPRVIPSALLQEGFEFQFPELEPAVAHIRLLSMQKNLV